MARSIKAKASEQPPHASVLVADELLYSLVGKAYLQGVYLSDISVPGDQVMLNQLIFMFLVEASAELKLSSFTLEITLPGSEPAKNEVVISPDQLPAGKERISYRLPMVLRSPVLRPGKIIARVTHELGEIEVNAISILRAQTDNKQEAS